MNSVKQEYLLEKEIERCAEFSGIKLIKFKDKKENRGIIVFNQDKYINERHNLTYIDIIYSAQGNTEEFITFENADCKITSSVLYGGIRMFALPIPSVSIIKNRFIKFSSKSQIDFKDIIIRQDYYDFIGLKSGVLYNIDSKKTEEKTIALSKEVGLEIQWFITWKCNYKCEYCWQARQPHIYRRNPEGDNQISSEIWAKKINQLKPRSLYITGGEPTLYKELPRLVSMLNPNIELTMTSNFGSSFNIEAFTHYVSPDRFIGLAFSLHPLQCDVNAFFKKLSLLAEKKFNNLLVEMVLDLKNLPYAELVLKKCKELGVGVRFDPCAIEGKEGFYYLSKSYKQLTKHYIEKANQQTQQVLMDLVCRHLYTKKYGLRVSRLIFKAGEKIHCLNNKYRKESSGDKICIENGSEEQMAHSRMPIYCLAGSKRITIDYEGNAYVCMSAIDRSKRFGEFSLPHYSSIGNIFSEDFKLLDRPIICWESFRCSACDYEPLQHTWTAMAVGAEDIPLPLPE